MVDFTDVTQVKSLASEHQSITAALDALDAGGQIAAVTILPPSPDEQTPVPLQSVTVQSIEDQSQIIEAVKAALEARLEELTHEISNLGVSGATSNR